MWQANVWDWLSTSLMFVGLAILLCLSAYLMLCLVVRTSSHSPDDVFDEGVFDARPVQDDRHELRWLAS